ncbi:unnamed protein product [Ceratitis capitata]|uniref:(Mediterranean fruit fly) hypothetical protein n=1 Tax=Ceratitis capitata TaxID=7213 RepID=A0A811UGH8_CERCA|nr:unnamed protein product [Ceratitis capitata]
MVEKALMKRPASSTPPSLGVYHYYHSDFYYSMPNISMTLRKIINHNSKDNRHLRQLQILKFTA